MNGTLSQLTGRSRKLLGENETLRQTERDLRREMGILESVVNDITHKNVSNQKVPPEKEGGRVKEWKVKGSEKGVEGGMGGKKRGVEG